MRWPTVFFTAALVTLTAGCAAETTDAASAEQLSTKTASRKFRYTATVDPSQSAFGPLRKFAAVVVTFDIEIKAPATATQEKSCEKWERDPESTLCTNQIVGLTKQLEISTDFSVNAGFEVPKGAHSDLDLQFEEDLGKCHGDLCRRTPDRAPFTQPELLQSFEVEGTLAKLAGGEITEIVTSFHRRGVSVNESTGTTLNIVDGGIFPVQLMLAVPAGKLASKGDSASRRGKLEITVPDTFTLPARVGTAAYAEDFDLELKRVVP